MIANLEQYSSIKESTVNWIGEVPPHWQVRRLKSVAKILNGATPSSSVPEYWDGDIIWITPEDLGSLSSRYVRSSARRITPDGYQSCGTTIARAGSVAISTRAPIGHIGILTADGCVNQGCKLLVPDESIDTAYLFYLLDAGQSELKSLGCGTTFAELSRGALGDFVLPIPSRPEQADVVRFLDHADRRIQRHIRAKQKLIALLEEQKQAIIHQAVTGQIDVRTGKPYPAYKVSGVEWLGDVPDRWDVVSLRRVTLGSCDGPFGSGLKSSHYTGHGVRVVRLQNIGHGEFKDSDAAFISPEHYSSLGDHSVLSGDVLIAGLGDNNHPAGRACVAPDNIFPAMVKADCFRFRLNLDQVQPRFAALQLTATASAASAVLSTGATRQRTNLQATSGRKIGVPSLAEQSLIIKYVTAELSGKRRARVTVQKEIDLLLEYRTRLIADVATGKLDVRTAAAEVPDYDYRDGAEESADEDAVDQEVAV